MVKYLLLIIKMILLFSLLQKKEKNLNTLTNRTRISLLSISIVSWAVQRIFGKMHLIPISQRNFSLKAQQTGDSNSSVLQEAYRQEWRKQSEDSLKKFTKEMAPSFLISRNMTLDRSTELICKQMDSIIDFPIQKKFVFKSPFCYQESLEF